TLGKQALLRMLQETTVDATQQVRHTSAPDAFVSRLAASGSLVRAINELPQPPDDLAVQSRQLAQYLQQQLQTDGTFTLTSADPAQNVYLVRTVTGPALAGLACAQKRGPGVDAVRRACPGYLAGWRQNKHPGLIASHSAAYAEAYANSGDATLAQAVFE